jgi:hypothetical protein
LAHFVLLALTQWVSNLSPEILCLLRQIGGNHIKNGCRRFRRNGENDTFTYQKQEGGSYACFECA